MDEEIPEEVLLFYSLRTCRRRQKTNKKRKGDDFELKTLFVKKSNMENKAH